jgi:flagellar hook-basal body complex protein FliE
MANKIKIAGRTFNIGNKLGAGELKKIAKKTEYTPESVARRLSNDRNVKLASSANNYLGSLNNTVGDGNGDNNNDNNNNNSNNNTGTDLGNLFQDVIGPFQESVANIQKDATTQSATIRGEADKEVARAYSDAQKYASQLGLEGTKYASDKESDWRQAVANIEVKGKLDLQPIINAGLERVSGIEAQASRDVAETTGKYSLKSMQERTAADKSLGKMQLAGSMYGLLGAAFG